MQQTIIEHLVPSARAKPEPFSQAPGKIVPVTKIPGTFGRQLTQIWVWASHATTATTLGVMFMMSPSLNWEEINLIQVLLLIFDLFDPLVCVAFSQ